MLLAIFILFGHAFQEFEQKQADILSFTGLTEKVIAAQTQNSLEKLLFYQDDGISCGLESFFIDSYTTETKKINSEEFTVVTEVVGPTYECNSYDQYMCFTKWKNIDKVWTAIYTECDDDSVADD